MTGPRALPDDDIYPSPIGPSIAFAAFAAHLYDRLAGRT